MSINQNGIIVPAAAAALMALAAAGCGSSKSAALPAADFSDDPSVIEITGSAPVATVGMVPRARIYRTSAPSDSLVPVTVSPTGTFVTSYPAPTDLVAPPQHLADGWLLDHRGITPQSVFTRYTYSEYRSLPAAPSADELLHSLDPSVAVTEIVELPMPAREATVAVADSLIRAGLPGCKVIFKR